MATLVIHAPYRRGKPETPTSFERFFKTGIGKGYAIYKKYIGKLPEGSKVVMLRNDKDKKRAEGVLVNLIGTGRYIPQGTQRYDVHFRDAKIVPYIYKLEEKLNRCGIAVVGDC